jgi:hypothetical protein
MKHPGIDDVQSSSFAGLAAGGVECNSTIPGSKLTTRHGYPRVVAMSGRRGDVGASSVARRP